MLDAFDGCCVFPLFKGRSLTLLWLVDSAHLLRKGDGSDFRVFFLVVLFGPGFSGQPLISRDKVGACPVYLGASFFLLRNTMRRIIGRCSTPDRISLLRGLRCKLAQAFQRKMLSLRPVALPEVSDEANFCQECSVALLQLFEAFSSGHAAVRCLGRWLQQHMLHLYFEPAHRHDWH